MPVRILVISTNNETSPQPTLPIGAAWVAEALDQAGFEVTFLDLCFEKRPLVRIDQFIRRCNPQGIAISIRNLDNCDFISSKSYLPELKHITDFIQTQSSARLLIGGSAVSIMPAQLLGYLGLEFALVGPGELAAPLFFSVPSPATAGIPGLVVRGQAATNPENGPAPTEASREARQAASAAVAAGPRLQRWVATESYLKLEPVLPVQGKRGCAKRCLYCTYPGIEGASWQLREPGAVVEEIACAMAQTGVSEFEFVDGVFNEPEGYLEALFEEILRRRLKARFRIASLTPKGLTRDQVRLMERGGLASAVITAESASDVTLAGLGKDFTEKEVDQAALICSGTDIRVLWCFLVGGPEEDRATLAHTIRFINRGIARKDSAFITTGIRVFPGTGLQARAVRDGLVQADDDLLLPRFYFSPKLPPQEAWLMLQLRLSNRARCIFPSDTRGSSLVTLRRLGTMLRVPGPFWRYAGCLNRFRPRGADLNRNW